MKMLKRKYYVLHWIVMVIKCDNEFKLSMISLCIWVLVNVTFFLIKINIICLKRIVQENLPFTNSQPKFFKSLSIFTHFLPILRIMSLEEMSEVLVELFQLLGYKIQRCMIAVFKCIKVCHLEQEFVLYDSREQNCDQRVKTTGKVILVH